MKVASWNLNHWLRKGDADRWDAIAGYLATHDVDVALLQETGPPPLDDGRFVYHRLSGLRAGEDYGTAVVALNPAVALTGFDEAPSDSNVPSGSYGVSHPGTIAAARAELDGKSLTVVSVYGRMLDAGNGVRYASTSVHRIISDLAPLLDRGRSDPPVLVAGDLNCTTQWERKLDRQMDESVFTRLEAHDLVDLLKASAGSRAPLTDCFCPAPAGTCSHIRTLRHRDNADSRLFHIDYAFASAGASASATVLDEAKAWELSDHAPLLIDVV